MSMSVYVALLRGINVGRAKRISMAELRAVFEALGHSQVRTLLNSGNVIFTAKGSERGRSAGRTPATAMLATPIERAIERDLGISSRVTVFSAAELDRAVRENPLAEASRIPSRFLVAFLRDPADRPRLAPVEAGRWTPERIAVGTRVAYLWCPDSITESPLLKAVTRATGDGMTARNWTTVMKLHEGATA